jgi:hypothetical protein
MGLPSGAKTSPLTETVLRLVSGACAERDAAEPMPCNVPLRATSGSPLVVQPTAKKLSTIPATRNVATADSRQRTGIQAMGSPSPIQNSHDNGNANDSRLRSLIPTPANAERFQTAKGRGYLPAADSFTG